MRGHFDVRTVSSSTCFNCFLSIPSKIRSQLLLCGLFGHYFGCGNRGVRFHFFEQLFWIFANEQ